MFLSAFGFVSWFPLLRLRGVCTARYIHTPRWRCWQGIETAGGWVSHLCLLPLLSQIWAGCDKSYRRHSLSGPLANCQTGRKLYVSPISLHHDPAAVCVPSVFFMKRYTWSVLSLREAFPACTSCFLGLLWITFSLWGKLQRHQGFAFVTEFQKPAPVSWDAAQPARFYLWLEHFLPNFPLKIFSWFDARASLKSGWIWRFLLLSFWKQAVTVLSKGV